VSEVDLGRIRLGQAVEVSCDAYPKERFRGWITYIASESEFTPRNIQTIDERRHQVFGVKVRVDDPRGIFKSGMAADVWVPLQAPDHRWPAAGAPAPAASSNAPALTP
jgi:multidrug resistance efflux pump